MNDAELRALNREAVSLALNRFMGDGEWHTFADVWARLQRDGNPLDTEGAVRNALQVLIVRGTVQDARRADGTRGAYRLRSVVE